MRLAVLVLLLGSTARAQSLEPLRTDAAVDGAITGSAAALWLGSELLFKKQLAPASCRWCSDDGFDRSIRSALVWSNPKTADTLSGIGAFGVAPLLAFGGTALAAHADGRNGNIGGDLLVVAEASALAQDLNQTVKFAIGRERPFVHQLAADQKARTAQPDDNNLSFFSGHTTWVFSLATGAGTVCSMHGYRYAPLVWASGLTVAGGNRSVREE